MSTVSARSALVLAGLLTLGACAGPQPSSAAPPTVVCATTLNSTPAGAVMLDATSELPVITSTTAGGGFSGLGPVYLRVAAGCDHGVTVSISPEGAATIAREADARDGLPAAVVLDVMSSVEIHVTGTRDGAQVASAEIHIPATTP